MHDLTGMKGLTHDLGQSRNCTQEAPLGTRNLLVSVSKLLELLLTDEGLASIASLLHLPNLVDACHHVFVPSLSDFYQLGVSGRGPAHNCGTCWPWIAAHRAIWSDSSATAFSFAFAVLTKAKEKAPSCASRKFWEGRVP